MHFLARPLDAAKVDFWDPFWDLFFSGLSDYDPASTGPKPGLAVRSESRVWRFGLLLYGSLSGASGEMFFSCKLVCSGANYWNFELQPDLTFPPFEIFSSLDSLNRAEFRELSIGAIFR